MFAHKLFLTAAAIVLPLGYAQAQTAGPETETSASTEQVIPAGDSVTTDTGAPATTAPTNGMSAQSTTPADTATADGSAATTADSSATADASAMTADKPVAVAKADVTAGATVLGSDGTALGKVESVTADAAVVSTGKAKAQIPFTSMGKTDKGLMIAMSKSQFEEAIAKSAS